MIYGGRGRDAPRKKIHSAAPNPPGAFFEDRTSFGLSGDIPFAHSFEEKGRGEEGGAKTHKSYRSNRKSSKTPGEEGESRFVRRDGAGGGAQIGGVFGRLRLPLRPILLTTTHPPPAGGEGARERSPFVFSLFLLPALNA